mgnify:CR=1 FL=1
MLDKVQQILHVADIKEGQYKCHRLTSWLCKLTNTTLHNEKQGRWHSKLRTHQKPKTCKRVSSEQHAKGEMSMMI